MSELQQKVRGFPDSPPEETAKQDQIISTAFKTARLFGFERVETPVVERAELFRRTSGESASIVNKEMYLLKGEDDLALRPEGTAGVARMFITEKLRPPKRFIYSGPMFRRERPQKGRFRQFTTVAVEVLGEAEGTSDVEVLSLACLFLRKLNLTDRVFLEINTIGNLEERRGYIKNLTDYLKPFEKDLSGESRARLEKNPLRILDSKQEEDQKILEKAPCITDSLSKKTKESFDLLKKSLHQLSIPFKENPRLVRGLDYYNHFVFEIKSPELGAQSALIAGGRYDGLVETLGGQPVPAVGWGAGVERLALLYRAAPLPAPEIGLVAVGDGPKSAAFLRAYRLREKGWGVFFRFSGSFSKQMKRVSEKNCPLAFIFGEKELKDRTVTVKNMKTKKQISIKEESLETDPELIKNLVSSAEP